MTGNGSGPLKLSEAAEKRAAELVKLYPDSKSAVMPILYIAQEELGYIDGRAVDWVAGKVGISPVHVQEVVTFYTMYYTKPKGKYHVQVCRTLSCAIRGAKKLTEHCQHRFGVAPNELTADGQFSYEEVECLGSCGTAPMCEINDHYFENLTPEKLEAILKRIEAEKPDLRLSTVRDELGGGLKNYTKSEIRK